MPPFVRFFVIPLGLGFLAQVLGFDFEAVALGALCASCCSEATERRAAASNP